MVGFVVSFIRGRTTSRECVAERMEVVIDVIDAGADFGAVIHSKRTWGTLESGNVAERWVAIA
jgi:hypothetical protein